MMVMADTHLVRRVLRLIVGDLMARCVPSRTRATVRATARLLRTSCVLSAGLLIGTGALALSAFRIGGAAWHCREVGAGGLVVTVALAVWCVLPRCPSCGRRTLRPRGFCLGTCPDGSLCGQWLGDHRHAERWS